MNETCFECITEFVYGQRIVTYDNKKFCDEDCLCEHFLWEFHDEIDEINYYGGEDDD